MSSEESRDEILIIESDSEGKKGCKKRESKIIEADMKERAEGEVDKKIRNHLILRKKGG